MKPTNQDVIKYLNLRLDSLESMIGHFIDMGIDCQEEKRLHNQLSIIQGRIMEGENWENYLEFVEKNHPFGGCGAPTPNKT